ncbi:efflux RND transporter periplasmic adaptor subunit [Novosphingobium album (ex Liu et al. 2023)]|uniref:Efflux RND transporter periplasmic adaptor subunit n=1 Tax=Novosphingobium album (ex Liu et al. 2023) TaxID=3031130 RepID=A0ABT5WSW6_9SPHN|nr:efflux RND transporter periplasmic adaptor subunit [Novosphingobium album (ex Liu et al. 2023)]MDE8653134.1 efflux RND transporter periplasmic adaptor subunit [Novosphingobium album (ex Liu et al. 2023)]
MSTRMDKKIMAGAGTALIALACLGYYFVGGTGQPDGAPAPQAPAAQPGALSAQQIARLGIRLEAAAPAEGVPLGTVPGQVTLPPQARVAVTAPFAGVAVRVLVLEGEQVAAGQPLAMVRAAQPVQFGAELARAKADLAVERAQAERLAMLAREGIVAGARADEARAAMRRTEATIAENRRLLALGGAGRDGSAVLHAPIAGRVASVAVETGGPVGGDKAPFVIENTARLTLDLQLPERLANTVRPGMAVDVPAPGAAGGKLTGRILSVGASLDPATRSILAKASLPAAPGLVPGQSVMAVIRATDSAPRRQGVSVPVEAVTRIDGQDCVFVRQGTRFARRKVTVVAQADGRAVISTGLNAGEAVAVSGVAELKSLLGGE